MKTAVHLTVILCITKPFCQTFHEVASSLQVLQPTVRSNRRFISAQLLTQAWSVTSAVQCVRECYVTTSCLSVNIAPFHGSDVNIAPVHGSDEVRLCYMFGEEAASEEVLQVNDGWTYVGE